MLSTRSMPFSCSWDNHKKFWNVFTHLSIFFALKLMFNANYFGSNLRHTATTTRRPAIRGMGKRVGTNPTQFIGNAQCAVRRRTGWSNIESPSLRLDSQFSGKWLNNGGKMGTFEVFGASSLFSYLSYYNHARILFWNISRCDRRCNIQNMRAQSLGKKMYLLKMHVSCAQSLGKKNIFTQNA